MAWRSATRDLRRRGSAAPLGSDVAGLALSSAVHGSQAEMERADQWPVAPHQVAGVGGRRRGKEAAGGEGREVGALGVRGRGLGGMLDPVSFMLDVNCN